MVPAVPCAYIVPNEQRDQCQRHRCHNLGRRGASARMASAMVIHHKHQHTARGWRVSPRREGRCWIGCATPAASSSTFANSCARACLCACSLTDAMMRCRWNAVSNGVTSKQNRFVSTYKMDAIVPDDNCTAQNYRSTTRISACQQESKTNLQYSHNDPKLGRVLQFTNRTVTATAPTRLQSPVGVWTIVRQWTKPKLFLSTKKKISSLWTST